MSSVTYKLYIYAFYTLLEEVQ